MSLAQTFSQLAEQLDAAVASLNSDSLSADDAATLLPLFSSLQRQLNTFVSFADARTGSNNIHFLDQRSRALTEVDLVNSAESSVFHSAEFAMVSGDNFTGAEIVTSASDDGRQFQWVGSQCIVSHA